MARSFQDILDLFYPNFGKGPNGPAGATPTLPKRPPRPAAKPPAGKRSFPGCCRGTGCRCGTTRTS